LFLASDTDVDTDFFSRLSVIRCAYFADQSLNRHGAHTHISYTHTAQHLSISVSRSRFRFPSVTSVLTSVALVYVNGIASASKSSIGNENNDMKMSYQSSNLAILN